MTSIAADSPKATHGIPPELMTFAVPIGSVAGWPGNYRVHDLPNLRSLLRKYGQPKAILAQQSSRQVFAGNGILKAARAEGWTHIAVTFRDWPDVTCREFLADDNKAHERGSNDFDALAAFLSELAAAGGQTVGYENDELNRFLASVAGRDVDPDDAPPPPAPAKVWVKPGDLFALGGHRLLCGDATVASDVARLTEGEPVELLWTDPPYGVDYVGGTPDAKTIQNDNLTAQGTHDLVRDALKLVPLRRGSSFYVASPAGPLGVEFALAIRAAGLFHSQTLVWVKDRFVLGRSDFHYRHEAIHTGWAPDEEHQAELEHELIEYGWAVGARHGFRGGRKLDTVWEVPRPARSVDHPTMKPVELVERSLVYSSAPGDRVMDPFCGSGTTLIACERQGRRGLGMELDPAYVQVSIERWQDFTGGKAEKL